MKQKENAVNELTEEQHARNWELLWDLRRNVRYFAKLSGIRLQLVEQTQKTT